jgi:hypothetical protein
MDSRIGVTAAQHSDVLKSALRHSAPKRETLFVVAHPSFGRSLISPPAIHISARESAVLLPKFSSSARAPAAASLSPQQQQQQSVPRWAKFILP